MDPSTWLAATERRYDLLLSSQSAVDTSWFAIGYDKNKQYLYWSDKAEKKIYRQFKDQTFMTRNRRTIELVFDGTSSQVHGIAVDWYSGTVYWTDAFDHIIYATRANAGRTDLKKAIINTNIDQPSGIVVHPARGYVLKCYELFTDGSSANPKIAHTQN